MKKQEFRITGINTLVLCHTCGKTSSWNKAYAVEGQQGIYKTLCARCRSTKRIR